ncbi:hypothetical protein [Deinococcus hohokamensis]|uniref:Uncharacterized protein n=1 Tax=Deinococcus hohokamensis TaxID=309883 RepID=A0ABV9I3M3_9DEIO
MANLHANETRALLNLRERDKALRDYLSQHKLSDESSIRDHLIYVHELNRVAGNINNHASAVSCILARQFLERHHDVISFDACEKLQGAKGIDLECRLTTGERVIGEVKTTIPYQGHKLGAAQLTSFKKDLQRLTDEAAVLKYFFLIDGGAAAEAQRLLQKGLFDRSIRVIDLLGLQS